MRLPPAGHGRGRQRMNKVMEREFENFLLTVLGKEFSR